MIDFVKKLKPKQILIAILIFTAFVRIFRIDYPSNYVFDEVYHAFTAKEILANHKEAWEWWNTPPPGVAYEWTHPPMAKEIMAIGMFLFHSQNPWAYRLPGTLFGILCVYLVYLLGKHLFKSENVGLLSAFIFSLDGLNIVQSRTGMNDIYFLGFTLASLYFFIRKKFIIAALMFGLALSSKWAAIYLFGVYFILLIRYKQYFNILYFLIIPPLVYLASYLPFFLQGHSLEIFKGLQQQMWWYHTQLKATHDYSSPWWSWPFTLYPVWYFVDYHKNGFISNIYASGNPVVYVTGVIAIGLCIYEFMKKRVEPLLIILLGYFAFWLPWALSPRIMFLYHYLPSVPFLSIGLGYQLTELYKNPKNRKALIFIILFMVAWFIFLFPFLTGIPLPKDKMLWFFQTNLTKNPFGS